MKRYLIYAICAALAVVSCASGGAAARSLPLDDAITQAAADINGRLDGGTVIALLNFSSPSEPFSGYVLEELSLRLVNGGNLRVVDRRELELVRGEEAFQLSGEVSDESARSLGRKLGRR